MKKIKLILDTDIGSDIDDALCMAYLLKHPRCELLGITTCSSEPEKRAELADSICRHAGIDIPIYPGLRNPIVGKQRQTSVHQYTIVEKLPHRTVFPRDSAIDFMREQILRNPHDVTLLCIGPLTNIGALLAAYPNLAPLIKEVAIMGGSYLLEGLQYTATEWNILNDVVAAKILFDSGVPTKAAGLDVTMRTKTSAAAFIQSHQPSIMEPILLYTRKFMERTDNMYYHDVLAAAIILEPWLFKTMRGSVQVGLEIAPGVTTFTEQPDGNVLLACDVDTNTFFEHYRKIIND